jgi:hypothetical protein
LLGVRSKNPRVVCPWAQKGGRGLKKGGGQPPIHNPPDVDRSHDQLRWNRFNRHSRAVKIY